jgi:hypothetical protein
MTDISATEPSLLVRDFRLAQQPGMWLGLGDDLVQAAEAVIADSMRQLSVYEVARDKALREAEKIAGDSGTGEGSAPIDALLPNFLPAFLLYGYAIENLMKGLLVLASPDDLVKDEEIGVPPIHDLFKLAHQIGITPSVIDETNLKKLTEVTTWSGRYPVTKDIEQFKGTFLDRAAIFHDPVRSIGQIRRLKDELRKKLAAAVPKQDSRSILTVMPDRTVDAGHACSQQRRQKVDLSLTASSLYHVVLAEHRFGMPAIHRVADPCAHVVLERRLGGGRPESRFVQTFLL